MSIIIDGKGSTITHSATAIANLLKIKLDTMNGERTFIDLTGLEDEWVNGLMSELKDMKTLTVTVKNDPAIVTALSKDNAALVVTFSSGGTFTVWCQYESDDGVTLESKARGETNIVYHVTNRNDSGVVTGPAYAAGS